MTIEHGSKEEYPDRADVLPRANTSMSWRSVAQTAAVVVLLAAAAVWAIVHFVGSAPPRVLTIATGPKGSTFEMNARRYRRILARNGIKLNILETQGSLDNLHRLADPKAHVDIALVQSGLAPDDDSDDLVSLGSMFYEPLMIFYRSPKPVARLSELASKRIAIGPEGSGTQSLALALLKANGIEPKGTTQLLSLEGDAATTALLGGRVDAIFLTGDSTSFATLRKLLHEDAVRLFEFEQADAYVRRFSYLSKLLIPAGAFDLGEGLPTTDTNLLAPTVELIAHSNLHPALSDLLIEAAFEVHGRASLLQAAGQFPNVGAHTLPISTEAVRYYKSGDRTFTYRYLPFWLASLVNRIVVAFVPILVVLVPSLRFLPLAYHWRINRRINRRYGEIMAVEREMLHGTTEERRAELLERLQEVERAIISRKIPGSHAEQVYLIRRHIELVREKLGVGGEGIGAAAKTPGMHG